MVDITEILGSDVVKDSREVIDANFDAIKAELENDTGTGALVRTLDALLLSAILTTPVIALPTMALGVDTHGDLYFRGSDGKMKRLAPEAGKVLQSNGPGADPSLVTVSSTSGALAAFSSTAVNPSFTGGFTQLVAVTITPVVPSKIFLSFNGLIAAAGATVIDCQLQFLEGSNVILGPQQAGGNVGTNVNQFSVGANFVYEKIADTYTFSVEMKNSFSADPVNVGVVNFSALAVPI